MMCSNCWIRLARKYWVCVFMLFICSLPAYAQKEGYVHHQTQTDSLSVERILSILSKAKVQLSYDPQLIPTSRILLPAGKWKVVALLKKIEQDTDLTYKKIGRNYILTKKEKHTYVISGTVFDQHSGEQLIGATIRIQGTLQGVITNAYGYYALAVPKGRNSLEINYLGYQSITLEIDITKDLKRDIHLIEKTIQLDELTVEAFQEPDRADPQFGKIVLTPNQFYDSPSLFGESDVLRLLQREAGVQMTSESSAGFSVRGSRPNQNLMLLDEAIVYNPTHVVGFFSIFNADALNKVSFYKGSIPAKYGGRLASVTNIQMKEGNNQRLAGRGSITPMTVNFTLEAPIKKHKSSFMLSGRRTYLDLLVNNLVDGTSLFFYDLNLKANYQLGKKDRLYVSSYFGKDQFRLSQNTFKFSWGNNTFTTRWNHIFNPKLFLNTSFIYSDYGYDLETKFSAFQFNWFTRLRNSTLKADFDYFLDNQTSFNFGFNTAYHTIEPAFLSFINFGNPKENISANLNHTHGIESALYVEVEKDVNTKLKLIGGLRFSAFHNIGPTTQFIFDQEYHLVDSIHRKRGEIFNAFYNLEPRFSSSYQLNSSSFLKFSYNRSVQYVSQAANSLIGSPLDIWFLASPNVEPQKSDQLSLGYFKDLGKSSFALAIEGYYKRVKNEIDFKDNAELLLNEQLDGELRSATARAYGLELGVNKTTGELTGGIQLTLSRSLIQSSELNNGMTYASNYDRPISLSISGKYAVDAFKNFRINWVLFSGLPFSSPTGRFTYGNVVVPTYTNRNQDRLPTYHRLDIGFALRSKKQDKAKIKGSWLFTIYNLYFRRNANFLTFRSVEGTNRVEAVKYTIFGWIPSVSYRFEF
ncbi:MAG: TonB-dependent receptor [Flammeovirgaceae bacterium]